MKILVVEVAIRTVAVILSTGGQLVSTSLGLTP